MILVGVLLVVLAALFVAGFMLEAGGSTEAEFYGLILPNLSARTLVLLGVVLGLLIAFGLGLIRSRIARWSQRRRARRAAAATPVSVDDLGEAAPVDPFTAPTPETR
jgi:uncharacterized protein HemY